MRTLIGRGADSEAEDKYNDTPVRLAAVGERLKAVRLFLDLDVNFESTQLVGENPVVPGRVHQRIS